MTVMMMKVKASEINFKFINSKKLGKKINKERNGVEALEFIE
jgi:hypothetical protein